MTPVEVRVAAVSNRRCVWLRSGSARPPWRAFDDRGAALTEYSLVFALLVVLSLGAIQGLTDRADDEATNQAECISKRPPPESCQLRSAVPPPDDPGPTPDPSPDPPEPTPPPTDPPPEPPPPEPVDATWATLPFSAPAADPLAAPGQWDVVAPVSMTHEDGRPMVGVQVRVTFTVVAPVNALIPQQSPTCVTGADGTCEVIVSNYPADAEVVEVAWQSVNAGGQSISWSAPEPVPVARP
ncbi:MAG: hypothetical protein JJU45_07710 [Acidimicrobiia bacterium]|nr:hypothetical protein [Acidimicrobiia bacterium]